MHIPQHFSVFMRYDLQRIESLDIVGQSVHHGVAVQLFTEGAAQAVPDNQGATVIAVMTSVTNAIN